MITTTMLPHHAKRSAFRVTASMSSRVIIQTSPSHGFSTTTRRHVPVWATVDPKDMGVNPDPYAVKNLVNGNWESATSSVITVPHPLDVAAPPIFTVPDTQISELDPFFKSLQKVPKSGVHNPLKNPERYVEYGEVSRLVRIEKIQHNLEK